MYPYNNYVPQMPAVQQQVIRVNGEAGAMAYQLAPNSSVLLLDDTNPIVWLKMTDGAGYATVTPYKIEKYQAPVQPNYSDLEARLKKLEEELYGKPNTSEVK